MLRDRRFLSLFLARAFGVLGGSFAPVALAFGVLSLPGATPSTLSVVLAAEAIPMIGFMLVGGVVADRFPRHRVMTGGTLLMAVAFFALAVMMLTGRAPLTGLVIAAAVSGIGLAVFFPALTGIIPQIVEPQHLQTANAYLGIAANTSRIAGFVLGGGAVVLIGPGSALMASAIVFAISAWLVSSLRPTAPTSSPLPAATAPPQPAAATAPPQPAAVSASQSAHAASPLPASLGTAPQSAAAVTASQSAHAAAASTGPLPADAVTASQSAHAASPLPAAASARAASPVVEAVRVSTLAVSAKVATAASATVASAAESVVVRESSAESMVESGSAEAAGSAGGQSVFGDLRDGWREFRSHQWLWVVVAQFSFLVMAFQAAYGVLGPVIAKQELGGAAAWSAVLAGEAVGTMIGVLIAMRFRPRRPIFVATLFTAPMATPFLALGLHAPLWTVVAGALVMGIAFDIFGVLWQTTMQREIPAEALSRVSSYDALGSLMFGPIGLLAAGPLAVVVGPRPALLGCAALIVASTAAALAAPGVRNLTTDLV